jgi:c-di-GMP phosphodiesterase
MDHVADRGAPDIGALSAAVDAAIPRSLAREWSAHLSDDPVLVARQGIFSTNGSVFAYQLSYRSSRARPPEGWSTEDHERATAHVLDATFGRDDFESLARGRHVVVRCPRAYLVGDLRLPDRPDRLIIEIPGSLVPDDRVLRGLAVLRADGFRIQMPVFSDSPHQRRLLPLADLVKIDVRDLDVEGLPVVRLARSLGAALIGEFVENGSELTAARDLGITLFQGNLLERATEVNRGSARPVGS